jgi:hypothetical protein
MTARTFLRIASVTSWSLLVCLALTTNSEAAAPTIANLSPNFGTVGATVIIYGNNFGATKGSSTVTFNGVNVTSGTWSNTKLTVIVPATATTGQVEVTTSGGSVSSTGDFNVLATNATLVMGAFPPQSSGCGLLPHGDDCITDYQNDVIPNVDGIVILAQWSSIESTDSMGTGSGGYTWTSLDNDVATYFSATNKNNWSASKKIGIVLSPVTDGGINTSTPAYVFTSAWATTAGASAPLDECNCTYYPGDSGAPPPSGCWSSTTNSDTSGQPAAWEKPFYVALENFYSAAVTHLNSASYSSAIAYVRMGLSGGGEEFPACSSNLESLVTPSTNAELKSVWTGYTDTMFVYESGLGSQHPLMAAPNGGQNSIVTDSWADVEASDAVANGLELGSEGLQFQDTIYVFTGLPCSNDWCNTFSTNNPPIREQQTLQQSVPAENVCGSNTSAGGDYTDTGSLVCLLPFVEGKANSVELYPGDMFLAYDPNYSGYSTYGSAYSTAISNARAGH